MTEREWFAEPDPLVLLAFVQEQSGVPLLKGPPPEPTGRLNLPELPGLMGRGGVFDLYRSPPDLEGAREAELLRRLHRYALACCRAIWPLLPNESSRRGVEVAEILIRGKATDEEFAQAEWNAEGAAFTLECYFYAFPPRPDYPDDPPFMARYNARRRQQFQEMAPAERDDWIRRDADEVAWIEPILRAVAALPKAEMRRMVRVPVGTDTLSLRRILGRAAYFAHTAIMLPGRQPLAGVLERSPEFLSADLLRRHVRYPLHPQTPGPGHVWWARYGTRA